jgi:hypothetical protein
MTSKIQLLTLFYALAIISIFEPLLNWKCSAAYDVYNLSTTQRNVMVRAKMCTISYHSMYVCKGSVLSNSIRGLMEYPFTTRKLNSRIVEEKYSSRTEFSTSTLLDKGSQKIHCQRNSLNMTWAVTNSFVRAFLIAPLLVHIDGLYSPYTERI